MTHPLPDHAEFAPLFRSQECVQTRDDAMMQRAFELRFQVYCQECGFLPAADYPAGRERDQYDAGSVHFCAFNLRHELVGYVRLVRPDLTQSFPFQSHGSALLAGVTLAPPAQAAEISRLMVRQDYRRRLGDLLAGVTVEPDPDRVAHDRRDHSSQILLSLYRQMYAFSLANGIRYWYAAMERSLARILARMSFGFQQIGPPVDYYGPVATYLGDLRELETRVSRDNPALLAWLRRREAREP